MDVDLNKISFLRRDRVYNFAKIDDVYDEITRRNNVYNGPDNKVLRNESDQRVVVSCTDSGFNKLLQTSNGDCDNGTGNELLHSALVCETERDPFNFVCTVPYTSGKEFDASIQKILAMHGRTDPIHAGPVPPDPPLSTQEKTICQIREKERESPNLVDIAGEGPFSSESYPRRVNKRDIPAAVRSTLEFGIAKQRVGGESLESEQQRRLQEFTLWRLQLMRSRAHPPLPPSP